MAKSLFQSHRQILLATTHKTHEQAEAAALNIVRTATQCCYELKDLNG
jgi:hypothetical protein